jgi:hypothetical protein
MSETPPDHPAQTPAEGPTDDQVESRSALLPEEQAAGSEDPEGQAEAILEESEERTDAPSRTRNDSTQTPGQE